MNQKLNILHLGSSSGLYGAEHWILALANYLNQTKFNQHVAAICDDSVSVALLCQRAAERGIANTTIRTSHRFSGEAISALRALIKDENIHIVHTHGYKTDLIGRIATINTNCKIISTPHGWTEKPDFKLWLYEIFDRCLFPFFDAVVPLSQGLYDPLSAIPLLKRKLHLIKNGVDLSEVDQTITIADEIMQLKNDGKFVIGYIGRLTAGKGLDTLLYAAAKINFKEFHIAFVGDGEQKFELEKLARSLGIDGHFSLFGFRTNRIEFLKGFDIFVLPSQSEGTPRCLMEAMGAHIPIIASDIPGCRNLIDDKKTGLLFKVNDSDSLAEKIESLHQDAKHREVLAKSASHFVKENYSAQRMATEYAALYHRLISQSRKTIDNQKSLR